MKSVIQRVQKASATVNDQVVGQIDRGMVVLVSVGQEDNEETAQKFVTKLLKLAVFEDEHGKIGKNIIHSGREVLVVSQFTLHANLKKGQRPSFSNAALPDQAQKIYQRIIELLKQAGISVKTGQFGAHMKVELINDGPVTYLLDIDE